MRRMKRWDDTPPVLFDGTPLYRQGWPGVMELLARVVFVCALVAILVAFLVACRLVWWAAVPAALGCAGTLAWIGRPRGGIP